MKKNKCCNYREISKDLVYHNNKQAIIWPQYSKHRSQSAYEDYVHHEMSSPNCFLHRYCQNQQQPPKVSVSLSILKCNAFN